MISKPIQSVTVQFADGSKQTWNLPNPAQGFYRERYTWQEDNNHRIIHRLDVHEVYWTYKVDLNTEAKEK